MNLKEILNLKYKYTIRVKHKLQELDRKEQIKINKTQRTFENDLINTFKDDSKFALEFLFNCQNDIKDWEKFYSVVDSINVQEENLIKRKASLVLTEGMSGDFIQALTKKIQENQVKAI